MRSSAVVLGPGTASRIPPVNRYRAQVALDVGPTKGALSNKEKL